MSMGRAFEFYAKYPQEMDAYLYDELNLDNVISSAEANELDALIKRINTESEIAVKDLLSECIDHIKSVYKSVKFYIVKKRCAWDAEAKLYRNTNTMPSKFSVYIGISIDTSCDENVLVAKCWVWFKNRKKASIDPADEMKKCLDTAKLSTANVIKENGGVTAYIHSFNIDPTNKVGLDKSLLVSELIKPFLMFGENNILKLAVL